MQRLTGVETGTTLPHQQRPKTKPRVTQPRLQKPAKKLLGPRGMQPLVKEYKQAAPHIAAAIVSDNGLPFISRKPSPEPEKPSSRIKEPEITRDIKTHAGDSRVLQEAWAAAGRVYPGK